MLTLADHGGKGGLVNADKTEKMLKNGQKKLSNTLINFKQILYCNSFRERVVLNMLTKLKLQKERGDKCWR